MTQITDLKSQLNRDEGVKLKPYKDTRGFWTIGCGHYLGDHIPPQFANGITQEQSDALLQADITHTYALMDTYLPWYKKLDPIRAAALANMAFNMGVPKLCTFHTFLKMMEAGNWVAAGADLDHTAWDSQVKDRADRLEKQIATGTWQ